MTVAGLLAFYCVADPLSRSDGPPSTEEFDAFLTGAERLFRFSADSLESAKFFDAVLEARNTKYGHTALDAFITVAPHCAVNGTISLLYSIYQPRMGRNKL